MNAAVILIVGIVILALGYVFYGGWLSKQWASTRPARLRLTSWKMAWTTALQRPLF